MNHLLQVNYKRLHDFLAIAMVLGITVGLVCLSKFVQPKLDLGPDAFVTSLANGETLERTENSFIIRSSNSVTIVYDEDNSPDSNEQLARIFAPGVASKSKLRILDDGLLWYPEQLIKIDINNAPVYVFAREGARVVSTGKTEKIAREQNNRVSTKSSFAYRISCQILMLLTLTLVIVNYCVVRFYGTRSSRQMIDETLK